MGFFSKLLGAARIEMLQKTACQIVHEMVVKEHQMITVKENLGHVPMVCDKPNVLGYLVYLT